MTPQLQELLGRISAWTLLTASIVNAILTRDYARSAWCVGGAVFALVAANTQRPIIINLINDDTSKAMSVEDSHHGQYL